MRVGIYGDPAVFPVASSLMQGVEALGLRPVARNAQFVRSIADVEDFDTYVVIGLHGGSRIVAEESKRREKPLFVVESGWIGRAPTNGREGTFQIGIGGLNSIPLFDMPSDRIPVVYPGDKSKKDGYYLVCLQKPDDAQHGMSREDINVWLEGVLGLLDGEQVRVRQHPMVEKSERALADDIAGAKAVVTVNSTAGIDALIAGTPVLCDEGAMYAEVAGRYGDEPKFPSKAAWTAFFSRLTYGQWTRDEIASGDPLRFLLLGDTPWVGTVIDNGEDLDRAFDAMGWATSAESARTECVDAETSAANAAASTTIADEPAPATKDLKDEPSRDDLIALAEANGVTVDGRWGAARLRRALKDFL